MFYTEAVQKQYRALQEQGLNVDVISMEHELSDYKIVAAPMAICSKMDTKKNYEHMQKMAEPW